MLRKVVWSNECLLNKSLKYSFFFSDAVPHFLTF